MTDFEYGTPEFKKWWMDFWGHIEGTPEGDEAWLAKCALMEGRHLRRSPMIFVSRDICYDSPVDGKPITSKQARMEDLKRNNCIEYDPGMKQDHERALKEKDAALDRSVEQHVEASFHKMPSAKRERLANELTAGVTADYTRLTAGG